MPNVKTADWYSGGAQGDINQPYMGRPIFVDGTSGSDTNSGLLPSLPVLTMTYALSLATANANDYIFVLGYPGEAVGETWPIAVNKAKVHIIGTPTQAAPSPLFTPPADTAAFLISASNVEVSGLEISAGASHGCIETSGGVWKGNVHDCFFAWQGTAKYGMVLSNDTDSADCPSWHVHDNHFGAGMTDHNLYVMYNSTRTLIDGNVFHGVASGKIGVFVDQNGAAVGAILDNTFKVADAANGEAITLIAGTASTIVFGNRTGEGNAAMTQTPYRDLGSNHFGLNYYDIRAIMPVTV